MTNATDGSNAPVDIDWARLKALYDEQDILIIFDCLGWERPAALTSARWLSVGRSWETVNAISKV